MTESAPPAEPPLYVVDVDDVLTDTQRYFLDWARLTFGHSVTEAGFSEDWAASFGITAEQEAALSDHYHAAGVMAELPPSAEAQIVLQALAQRGNRRFVNATSRPTIYPSVQPITIDWINKHFSMMDKVFFSGAYDTPGQTAYQVSKLQICRRLGASYLIDNEQRHIDAVSRHGIVGLWFGRYSLHDEVVLDDYQVPVKDWMEVKEYCDVLDGLQPAEFPERYLWTPRPYWDDGTVD